MKMFNVTKGNCAETSSLPLCFYDQNKKTRAGAPACLERPNQDVPILREQRKSLRFYFGFYVYYEIFWGEEERHLIRFALTTALGQLTGVLMKGSPF